MGTSHSRITVPFFGVLLCAPITAQVTQRVSLDSSGAQANDLCGLSAFASADGRYVVFNSRATNLVPGDTNGKYDIFVRDRQNGTTERVNVASDGTQANGQTEYCSISADGRYVAFSSNASILVPGDTNGQFDVFVRDRQSGTTELSSVATDGAQGNGYSGLPALSADGRYVAFLSYATNLVPGDTNGTRDIFVRDRQSGTTERVGESSDSTSVPSISDDGRYVAFVSFADVFVRDRQNGTTERVSVDSGGAGGNGPSFLPSISADGRYVAFQSSATNLVPGDTNAADDIFVRDRQSGTTERVSVDSGGAQGNLWCGRASVRGDGRYIVFASYATSLVPGDTNNVLDVFVRDRIGGTAFTSLCDPGVGGVVACPCSNPPSGPGRGCDNSAATGGASLSASGGTFVSSDSLVFTTSGEKPTALSTVWQGSTSPATGIVYGQGVRCVNGSLKRLYSKAAVGGSITAPNFGAGDPTVSARSATLGVPILPGASRYYFVSYRDPIVLGSCPAGSTFNATQTGLVAWSP